MSKNDYQIKIIPKFQCEALLNKHHYLAKISKGFKSGYNYGLIHQNRVVGVCIFTGFPVPELAVGMFGIEREKQDGLFELSRLVMCPNHQKNEHNITSWFVSRCIKTLRKTTNVKAILSYADNDHHNGTIYRALNFDYYGLTDAKKDYWVEYPNGEWRKQSRGKIKEDLQPTLFELEEKKGEWRDRSRKHRFLMVFDKNLNVKWEKIK